MDWISDNNYRSLKRSHKNIVRKKRMRKRKKFSIPIRLYSAVAGQTFDVRAYEFRSRFDALTIFYPNRSTHQYSSPMQNVSFDWRDRWCWSAGYCFVMCSYLRRPKRMLPMDVPMSTISFAVPHDWFPLPIVFSNWSIGPNRKLVDVFVVPNVTIRPESEIDAFFFRSKLNFAVVSITHQNIAAWKVVGGEFWFGCTWFRRWHSHWFRCRDFYFGIVTCDGCRWFDRVSWSLQCRTIRWTVNKPCVWYFVRTWNISRTLRTEKKKCRNLDWFLRINSNGHSLDTCVRYSSIFPI